NWKNYMFSTLVKCTQKLMEMLKPCVQELESKYDETKALDMSDVLGVYGLDTFIDLIYGAENSCNFISTYLFRSSKSSVLSALKQASVLMDQRAFDLFWSVKKTLQFGAEGSLDRHIQTIRNFFQKFQVFPFFFFFFKLSKK
ncbi:hypothetical protein RFI_33549, partial [Reticulomyxa filosa]